MIYRIPLANLPGGASSNMFLVWVTLETRNTDPEVHNEPKRWGFDAAGDPLEFAIIGIGG